VRAGRAGAVMSRLPALTAPLWQGAGARGVGMAPGQVALLGVHGGCMALPWLRVARQACGGLLAWMRSGAGKPCRRVWERSWCVTLLCREVPGADSGALHRRP